MYVYFLPIVAAILYGLNYALMGRILDSGAFSLYIFYSSLVGLLFSLAVVAVNRDGLNLYLPFQNLQLGLWILLAALAAWTAWFFTLVAIRDVSPTFAAIGEVSYPIFVPLFAYILFKDKQWDMATLIGGGLIFLGLFIVISGKMRG